MGHIYDAVTALIDVLRFGDYTTSSYWAEVGKNLGIIVSMIGYVPKGYEPYVGPIPSPPTPASPASNSTTNRTMAFF